MPTRGVDIETHRGGGTDIGNLFHERREADMSPGQVPHT